MSDELSHFDERGAARMVDVGDKAESEREAVASGAVEMAATTLARIRDGGIGKGDVLAVARIAAIGGVKRTSEDIEAMAENFSTFVRENPGLRIEQINKQLGTTTKDLALPIRKLLAEGVITAKGQKRSTTYFPGKKAKK